LQFSSDEETESLTKSLKLLFFSPASFFSSPQRRFFPPFLYFPLPPSSPVVKDLTQSPFRPMEPSFSEDATTYFLDYAVHFYSQCYSLFFSGIPSPPLPTVLFSPLDISESSKSLSHPGTQGRQLSPLSESCFYSRLEVFDPPPFSFPPFFFSRDWFNLLSFPFFSFLLASDLAPLSRAHLFIVLQTSYRGPLLPPFRFSSSLFWSVLTQCLSFPRFLSSSKLGFSSANFFASTLLSVNPPSLV